LRRVDAGEPVDRDHFISQHPAFAAELHDLLEAADAVDILACGSVACYGRPNPATVKPPPIPQFTAPAPTPESPARKPFGIAIWAGIALTFAAAFGVSLFILMADATEFYRQNRAEMDEGAVVAWPERFNHDELSAVQHAMNLKLQDERAFWAEYQNEPLPEEDIRDDDLSVDDIAGKVNRLRRGEVPIGCNHLTVFVEVQQTVLFYVVTAWEDDFTGYIIAYGAYPDQGRAYFTARDAQPTLAQTRDDWCVANPGWGRLSGATAGSGGCV